jgi:hypothetical protein
MPRLLESLEGKDLGYLAFVAECWGIEVDWAGKKSGALALAKKLNNPRLFAEIYQALPEQAQSGLNQLQSKGGKMPWSQFEREFGSIRALGPGKRDKIQPQREPSSIAELLWYRALIGRAFLESANKLQEFAFLPEEIKKLVPAGKAKIIRSFGRNASLNDRKVSNVSGTTLLDEMTSFIAATRSQLDLTLISDIEKWEINQPLLAAFAQTVDLVDHKGSINIEKVEQFLTSSRSAALSMLCQGWLKSNQFAELNLLSNLVMEGKWGYSPKEARELILQHLLSSADDRWVHIDSTIQDFETELPDFLRSGGEYDSWFLKEVDSDIQLKGFESWKDIEGNLIRFIIEQPAYWLGIVELGYSESGGKAQAFRLLPNAKEILAGSDFPDAEQEEGQLKVDSQGLIQLSRDFSRAIRYQISRFCEWEGIKKGHYQYRILAKSLERGKAQGLSASQLLSLLEKHASSRIAPNIVKAINRWEREGSSGEGKKMLVLRFRSPELLEAFKKSRGKRYLVEILGPTSISIERAAARHVRQVLIELGHLFEIEEDK